MPCCNFMIVLMMLFSFESLFESCGYIATFVGTLLEGEISLMTAVIGVKLGYFRLIPVLVLAFLGASIADWFKFIVAKTKGRVLIENKPTLKIKIDKATNWFEKYPYFLLTFYKLFFGLTTIILIISGIKDISYLRFAIHSSISILLWLLTLGGLGYYFGESLIMKINMIAEHKLEFIIILFLFAFAYWLFVKKPYQKKCLDCQKDRLNNSII